MGDKGINDNEFVIDGDDEHKTGGNIIANEMEHDGEQIIIEGDDESPMTQQ